MYYNSWEPWRPSQTECTVDFTDKQDGHIIHKIYKYSTITYQNTSLFNYLSPELCITNASMISSWSMTNSRWIDHCTSHPNFLGKKNLPVFKFKFSKINISLYWLHLLNKYTNFCIYGILICKWQWLFLILIFENHWRGNILYRKTFEKFDFEKFTNQFHSINNTV